MADAPGRADILEGHRHGLPAGGEGLALLPTIASFWLGMATSLLLGILALPSLRAAVAAADPVWVAGLGGAGAATTVVALGIVLLRGGEAARRLTLAQGRIADLERIRADIVPISMILLDPEDRIVWWNDKFLGFLSPPERAVLRRGLLFEDALLRWCELADFQFQGLTGAPAAQARLAYHRDYAGPFEECWGPWVRTSEHRTPDGGTLIMHVEIGDVKARERQLAEEAAQARIASVLENVLAMILVLDADDRVVYWNRNYTANMSPEVGALVERGITLETLLERFAAEDRRSDPDNRRPHFDHSRRLARHRHYDGPFEEHLPDGRVLWTIEHRMPDGGTIILSTDITGVKRVEAELRASEQRLRTIFQHSPIALAVTAEARETVLLANGRFAEMVERPVGAVAGREMAELFGGDAPFTRLRMLLRDGRPTRDIEIAVPGAAGPRWLLVTVERIVFDGRAAFLWWFFDITDQKTTEIALRDSEMQLALVMSGTNDGIWDLDLRTRRLRHSPRYFTMLGYEEQAVAGMLERGEDEFLAMVHPGDLSGLLAAANAHLRGETAAFEAAFRMRRRDGGWAWILSRGRAMPGPDGTPVRFVGAHTDITAQKRAEDELRQAMDVADSANRAKTNFLAMMSHEIRTPMNGVMGLLELLAATPLNDDQGELVQVVQESTTSLLQIIDDILDFSKIEAGRMQIDQVPVSPLALVESVAEALAPAAHKRRLALACYVAPDVPELVNGDPVRLRQVIYNLLGNAIKFTERGHVQVTVARAVGTDGAPALRFAVEDTGIGLAEDVRQRLFQPFTQADSSTTRRFGGTGLGLSISRRLVEMMGGTIGVESRLGEGSTFWFTLRLDAGASGAAANIDLSGVRVLLGEDEAPSRAAIRLYLEQCGAAVELADGGLDAMAKIHGAAAAGRPYDVALIDYDVLAECPTLAMVLADPAVNGTRGVQLSGLDGDGRRQLPADGFFAQLTKPVHRNALRQTVAVAAGRLPAGTLQGVGAAAPPAIRPPSRAQALAAGTLILVAEDNPTNQFVVRRQLGQLGFCADVVDDGAAALAAWRETGYGLVLTDLHMPHMDGVELTRAIRAAEGDSGRRVPIVALTANALAGEANRCLAAGMDDYLSKPVNLAQLDRALRRWLTPGDGSEADAGPVPPLPAASDAPADAPDAPVALAQLIELFGAIDDDARDMLFLFLSTTEPLFDEMEAALARGDFAAGKGAAHTAKGASRSAAALPLGELCYAIETAMRAGDAEAGAALLPQARAEFQRVAAFIRAL